jgi:sec-independent protein translocase protein TatB
MLDFSWSHILIILVVALVVVGPKDLPKLMRIVGRWLAKARTLADQFRKSFDEMARQSELDELRQEIDALRAQRPLADIHDTLHQSILPPGPMPAVESPKSDGARADIADPPATPVTAALMTGAAKLEQVHELSEAPPPP